MTKTRKKKTGEKMKTSFADALEKDDYKVAVINKEKPNHSELDSFDQVIADDYSLILKRLESHCYRSWIFLQEDNRYKLLETGSIPAKVFHQWVKQVFPIAKTKQNDVKYYESKENQEAAIISIANFNKQIQDIFKLYGAYKTEEKKGEENE